jgi:hypothetical protein
VTGEFAGDSSEARCIACAASVCFLGATGGAFFPPLDAGTGGGTFDARFEDAGGGGGGGAFV